MRVEGDEILFRYADPDARLRGVRLYQEIERPRTGAEFERVDGAWELRFARPRAARLEYLFELVHPDGSTELVTDPGNPRRTSGAFGDKSVVELPGYAAPAWLDEEPKPGETTEVAHGLLWQPAGTGDEPLPLLVVHDGPEYAEHSRLLHLLAVTTTSGTLPPMRALLLRPPGDRDTVYAASPDYARTLVLETLPVIARPPGAQHLAGMGASLGAVAMLHAHRRYPGHFGGLFLQSGSFFQQRLDPQESGFGGFGSVTRFVADTTRQLSWPDPVPVVMTCGAVEENLLNNRAMFSALRAQGYDVVLHENPDAHNWVGWRDTFDPDLVGLLKRLWSQ